MTVALRAVEDVKDWLPKKIQQQAQVISLSDALPLVHAPKTKKEGWVGTFEPTSRGGTDTATLETN